MRQELSIYWLINLSIFPPLAKLTSLWYFASVMKCPFELPYIHISNILVTS